MECSIVVVGSCVLDLVSYTDTFPRPGETIRGSSFEMGYGGKGANQCVAASKLGAQTALVGRVGKDSFGECYLNEVKKYKNIVLDHVKVTEGVTTGTASIIVNSEGENAIVMVEGANQSVTAEDIDEAEHLFKNAKVLICQDEINETATLRALSVAKKYKVVSLMNAAPARKEINSHFLTLPDIFCVNETEAEALTGVQVTTLADAERACQALKRKGCHSVIITLGKDGAAYYVNDFFEHITSPKVDKIADTTGAGDAFVGALGYFLSMRPDLTRREMIKRACLVASVSVQRKGTQKSFPEKSEVQHILDT